MLNPRPFLSNFSRFCCVKPEPILPPSCFVGTATWEIEKGVKEVQRTQPDPGDSSVDCLSLIPLDYMYSSGGTHPNTPVTLVFITLFSSCNSISDGHASPKILRSLWLPALSSSLKPQSLSPIPFPEFDNIFISPLLPVLMSVYGSYIS